MAIITTLSNYFKLLLMQKEIDFDNDNFRMILMSGEFSFDPDTDYYYNSISGEEVENGGYVATGQLLAGGVLAQDNDNNKVTMSWDDPSWTASGETMGPCRGVVIYDDSVTNDPTVGFADFGSDVSVNASSVLQIQNVVLDLS